LPSLQRLGVDMTYDKKICDEYVNNLNVVNMFKGYQKDYQNTLNKINYVVKFLESKGETTKAAIQTQNQIKRYLLQVSNRSIEWEKRSLKSTKKYQEYCANKEST
jgi:hypothetical protein